MQLVELDKHRITELLDRLGERLRRRGVAASVYLVGGAAIALTVADKRSTRDVDGWVSDQVVLDEARALAAEEGLAATWLNDNAAAWVPARVSARRADGPGLDVQVAPAEHLLAMKMAAMRARDVDDILALARHLGMERASGAEFGRLLTDTYSGEGQLQTILNVPDDQVAVEAQRIGARVALLIQRGGSSRPRALTERAKGREGRGRG